MICFHILNVFFPEETIVCYKQVCQNVHKKLTEGLQVEPHLGFQLRFIPELNCRKHITLFPNNILRAVGRELMEELWKGGWRRAMTLLLDRSRICVGILIIIEMNLSRSSYFFILVPDGARPPSDQIVSLILLGTGANSPQTLTYFLSYLLPEFKMIIERCCWRQATFAPQQEWTWCRLTPLNCSKTKIIFVDQDYLRKFHIIFCFQYEISVEQLVLTELDSVLKVETQFGHCCEFSSHEF